jgi:hypothetical protein
LLEREASPPLAVVPVPADQRQRRAEEVIVCVTCAHPITREGARIRILDAHEHRFMNPAGFLFHIGCFAHADGCLVLGETSEDYPWFPGCAWRVALCAGCGDHLGWRFQSSERTFFGLRLDRLRAGGAT